MIMLKIRYFAIAAVLTLAACSPQTSAPESAAVAASTAANPAAAATIGTPIIPTSDNPLLAPSTLPYQAPPFDLIKDKHFLPAFTVGMQQQLAAVKKIANNPEPATFENTLVALEKTGQTLGRVNRVFNLLSSANTNDARQQIKKEIAPKLAAHSDAIYLNDKLFERIKAIHENRDSLNLDPESARLVEWYYNDFVHHGALLSAADKAKLKKLNQEESTLRAEFEARLLAATKAGALVVEDKAKLAGLSDAEIATARTKAEGRGLEDKWLIPLVNTTQQPALASLDKREVRKQLFQNSWTRTEQSDENDTREIISRMAEIRAEQAKLLGYPNYAAWKLVDQMAGKPQAVFEFVRGLVPAATAKAEAEAAAIQARINASGEDFELQPWDWNYYAEQVRKQKFDLNEDQIKPYFELESVVKNGIFYAANQLYGLTFKERHDLPVWLPGVHVYEVFNPDGSTLALFYTDYFKRDSKGGGAWMSNLVAQSKLLGTIPVIYNVANITKPAQGEPVLLSFDEVITLFHEFGHALHGMFADQKYPSLSGTNVARDFVEFPSQFNEHWATNPEVFANYAKHYKTGEPMPQALVDKLKASSEFNQGYALTELLAAALLDMSWHTLPADAPEQDVDAFELASLKKNHLDLSAVPPRYRSSYFMHIWGHAYAAGYYAYLWTEMLAEDAAAWFDNHGGMTRENGQRFRDMILSRGNTEDLSDMYRNWRGRAPSIEPMLEARGLDDSNDK